MRNMGAARVLILLLPLVALAPVSEAGCHKCNTDKRCEAAAPGEDGKKECLDYTACASQCERRCTTDGEVCTGAEGPSGPESQGLSIPNGQSLPRPFAPPLPSLEESVLLPIPV